MTPEIRDQELDRLKALNSRNPVWLKCLWTVIALLLAALAFAACIANGFQLIQGKSDGGLLMLGLSVLGCVISLLLLGVSRDLWMLPRVIEGGAKTWLL